MRRVARFLISLSLVLAMSGVFASTAGARDYVMSGDWKYQNNQGRVLTVDGGNGAGANPYKGAVVQSGLSPASIKIPANQFTASNMFFIGFPTLATIAQLASTTTINQPNAATLAAGSGPGARTMCPKNNSGGGGGAFGNPDNPNCTNPANATGGFHGLVRYTAGANQFGGTFQILRARDTLYSPVVQASPLRISHRDNNLTFSDNVGGPSGFVGTFMQNAGVITEGAVLFQASTAPGYLVGAIKTPGVAVGMGAPQPTNFASGFGGLTTGTITVQKSVPVASTLTAMGSDARTGEGVGSITLVGGGTTNGGGQPFVNRAWLEMSMGPAVPSMSNLTIWLMVGLLVASVTVVTLRARSRA